MLDIYAQTVSRQQRATHEEAIAVYGDEQHQQQSVVIASSTCLSYYNIHQGNRGYEDIY